MCVKCEKKNQDNNSVNQLDCILNPKHPKTINQLHVSKNQLRRMQIRFGNVFRFENERKLKTQRLSCNWCPSGFCISFYTFRSVSNHSLRSRKLFFFLLVHSFFLLLFNTSHHNFYVSFTHSSIHLKTYLLYAIDKVDFWIVGWFCDFVCKKPEERRREGKRWMSW